MEHLSNEDFMFNNRTTVSLGRNGVMKTIGVNVWRPGVDEHDRKITSLTPINSQGNGGRCHIEIPIESCPYAALEAVMTQKKLLPLLMGLHPLLDTLISQTLSKGEPS